MIDPAKPKAPGFTLIELLIVVAIIGAMAAVALPAIGRYIRNYQIRAATQQVAGEIQTARARAIMKNVNFGAVFLVKDTITYQWVLEDLPGTGGRQSLTAGTSLKGQNKVLPMGVEFSTACPNPPAGAVDSGMRFNRMGAWCDPGSDATTCPDLGTGANLIRNTTTGDGSVVCLRQPSTGLTRTITVTPGGRILAQP